MNNNFFNFLRFGYDESIFDFYKIAYDKAISSNKSKLHLNTIQNRLKIIYNRMIPDEIKKTSEDNYYKYIESLEPYKDSEGNIPKICYGKKIKCTKDPRKFKHFFPVFKSDIDYVEEDLSEHFSKKDNANIELQKLTETFEKPAYEKVIEEFYEL